MSTNLRHLGIAASKLLGIAAALVFLGACRTTGPLHVDVDPALATADVYEVKGLTNRHWGKPVSFGGFSTRKTRVGETWAWTSGTFGVGVGKRTRPYRFIFVGERGEEWKVECRAKTPILRHVDDRGEWEVPLGETQLGCAMQDPTGARVHALTLAGIGDFRGSTDFGGAPIEIRSLDTIAAAEGHRALTLPGAIGYELRQDGRVIAGVDVLDKGRVYLARDLAPELRTPVAMTATVLLLFHES
jgi:hypothetical protein